MYIPIGIIAVTAARGCIIAIPIGVYLTIRILAIRQAIAVVIDTVRTISLHIDAIERNYGVNICAHCGRIVARQRQTLVWRQIRNPHKTSNSKAAGCEIKICNVSRGRSEACPMDGIDTCLYKVVLVY
jgi:hypothetical protein